ncbi:MAK10-like protein [Tanacetum coccineum]
MGDKNPIRTLGDYSKLSYEGYRNTIELPVGNNVVPLRSDTIRLVQNGCSFHGLQSEDPNQHLKDFLKLVESLNLDGSISTWEDLTTSFFAHFFPPGRTAKLCNDILMFQQHHGECLSEAWTRFKDLLQTFPHHGIDLWLQVQFFFDHVNPITGRTIDQSAGGKLRDLNPEESWAILEDLALYDNESWNDLRDFLKPVKAITLPQDVLSTSGYRLIDGPRDTRHCMENPEQAFVEYASSRTDEAKEGLVSEFMASQDARLSKFEADFKQQQSEMTNKIDTVLKAITDQIAGTLPTDTIKNPKLGTHPVSFDRSYPTMDPQCSTQVHSSINTITFHPKQPEKSQVNEPNMELEEESIKNANSNPQPQPNQFAFIAIKQVRKLNSMLESLGLVPQSSNTKFVCSKEDDGEVMFIEIIRDDDEPQNEGPNEGEGATTEEPEEEYFDTFPTRNELTYHRYLMSGLIPSIFLRNPIISEGCPYNLKIPCNIGHIMRRKLDLRGNTNGGISNFTGRIKGMHVFVRNFTYVLDFMIIEDISSIIDPRLSQVILGRPFVEISNMTHDPPEGDVRFVRGADEVTYNIPHKIEQYDSLSDLEKEHTKSVYLRNEEDKRRVVEYVMSKILGFYKECLELEPEYLTGVDDEGEVT